jgi:hypothetical protein
MSANRADTIRAAEMSSASPAAARPLVWVLLFATATPLDATTTVKARTMPVRVRIRPTLPSFIRCISNLDWDFVDFRGWMAGAFMHAHDGLPRRPGDKAEDLARRRRMRPGEPRRHRAALHRSTDGRVPHRGRQLKRFAHSMRALSVSR